MAMESGSAENPVARWTNVTFEPRTLGFIIVMKGETHER